MDFQWNLWPLTPWVRLLTHSNWVIVTVCLYSSSVCVSKELLIANSASLWTPPWTVNVEILQLVDSSISLRIGLISQVSDVKAWLPNSCDKQQSISSHYFTMRFCMAPFFWTYLKPFIQHSSVVIIWVGAGSWQLYPTRISLLDFNFPSLPPSSPLRGLAKKREEPKPDLRLTWIKFIPSYL